MGLQQPSDLADPSDLGGISRSEFVYTRLKALIKERQIQPGQRLREADIAARLGVSRTPVREAMHRLISERLLVLSPTRGIAVAELDRQQVLELYEVREFLEGAAARYAAQHASVIEIQTLRDMLGESRLNTDDPPRHAAFNRRFHAAICAASHNRYLQLALSGLADSLGLVRGTTFEVPGRPELVYEEHLAIIDAIERRDAEGAEQAARDHIRKAGRIRLKMLFDQY